MGSGAPTFADSGTGDKVGLAVDVQLLVVPFGYASGDPLSDTSTYLNQTFASLGVTPGTYVWRWGSAEPDQSFTLIIGPAAVPEPASLVLLGTSLALAGFGTPAVAGARHPERLPPGPDGQRHTTFKQGTNMALLKQLAGAATLGVALLLGSSLFASPAQAGYVVTLQEVGSDVVATGGGPIH